MLNKIISEKELNKFGKFDSLSSKALALLEQQKSVWELLRKNYNDLNNIQLKNIKFKDTNIYLQYNPGRIRSTSAKVDLKSINERKCFLCLENLPEVQKGIPFDDYFLILCNPYPIFKEHFTIVHKNHIPQTIYSNFNSFLELIEKLEDKFTVFYNGPKCGASAPDHLHFQAGTKGVMPLESEYDRLKNIPGTLIFQLKSTKLFAVDDGLRKMLFLEGKNKAEIESLFYKVIDKMKYLLKSTQEPMLNILGIYNNYKWKLIIFPREKHRPDYYFLNGKDKIMVSPATVDMSGLIIVPREEDFRKIDKDQVVRIYEEVTLSKNKFYELKELLKSINI